MSLLFVAELRAKASAHLKEAEAILAKLAKMQGLKIGMGGALRDVKSAERKIQAVWPLHKNSRRRASRRRTSRR